MPKMKRYAFTARNVMAGERNKDGEMILRSVGDVTLHLEGMSRSELRTWEWLTASLNTQGVNEKEFQLTVEGWVATHPEAGLVGFLFQGAGTRVHVEWYHPATDDFVSGGCVANLRHGVAAIVNARQQAGYGLPADPEPEPVKVPAAPERPARLADWTKVRYHGSLEELRGGIFRVAECQLFDECDLLECEGYALIPVGSWRPCAVHVGLGSVTPLESAA